MPGVVKNYVNIEDPHELTDRLRGQFLEIDPQFDERDWGSLNNPNWLNAVGGEERLLHFIHAFDNLGPVLNGQTKDSYIHVWSI